MAAWWKPTAEGYFRHIAKPAILEAVSQYAPAHVTRLSKLKKGDIASEAERLAEGSGWMPAVFHIDHDTEPEGAPAARSEEHTSELQSLMRTSYAVFCLKK